MLLFIEAYHRTVHPRFIFGYKRQIGVGILKNHREQTVAENEVALYQDGVILLQLFFHHRERIDVVGLVVDGVLGILYLQLVVIAMADVIYQFLSLITHDDDDTVERESRQLSEQTVYQSYTIHWDHTFGILLCQFSESAAHSCRQNDCLHIYDVIVSL